MTTEPLDREARARKDPYDAGPILIGEHDFSSINDKISSLAEAPLKSTGKGWILGFAIGFLLLNVLMVSIVALIALGTGIWGINIPVGWGFAIINFVWWIGIGHAGTLISAILLLFHQQWRNSINRFAEAMTLFAVACAGMFPLLHTGRPWFAYWLMPYPNSMGLWPQFRSPLVWDVFAVTTYGSVSLIFWYIGMIPDLATLRDRATTRVRQVIFGFASMGWRGSARHWERYETAYLLLAGLSTPLVLSVHTIVSFDFATSIIPGWHATFFPPYFVAGAIYAGFAMVLNLAIPIRKAYKMEDVITMRHLDNMAKILLATGLIVAYAYVMELFYGWYSASEFEIFMLKNRTGMGAEIHAPYWWTYWMLIFCNLITPQLLWFKNVRRSPVALFIISLIVGVGMWLERFVIVVVSMHRDYLPSSWGMYSGTAWDWAMYIGTIGLFLTLFYLFVRFLPIIPMFEVKHLLPESHAHGHED
ncbi:MAG: polysulfide reductase NrfD [Acidobacteria bacterium]|nr:polysulfide reductase NrfD [Acidobacteriota bacterium]